MAAKKTPKPTGKASPAAPAAKAPVSIITCDMEGRIETFNDGAERIFGYKADEVVGKRRVSMFSPGHVVLGHVPKWLKEAREKGECETDTVFVGKDGAPIPARIRVTPTFKDGKQIGYCGQTRVLEGVDPATIMPKRSVGVRIFSAVVIGRLPFLTATIVPVLVAAAWAYSSGSADPFPGLLFALTLIGAALLHVAANTFNDYFDWTSGTDKGNNDYFLPFSGGSRSIELGLITPRGLFATATAALAIAAACGAWLTLESGWGVLAFGAVGALSGFFYTAPPLRLAARRGLGELFVGLNFGPLVTAGTVYALTGSVGVTDFLVGIPVGLLTTAILWVNEFPDTPSDARAGKHHLVATLGLGRARWGYVAIVAAAYLTAAALAATGVLPLGSLLFLVGVPFAVHVGRIVVRHYADRSLIRASAGTIQMHLVAGLAMAAGLAWIG